MLLRRLPDSVGLAKPASRYGVCARVGLETVTTPTVWGLGGDVLSIRPHIFTECISESLAPALLGRTPQVLLARLPDRFFGLFVGELLQIDGRAPPLKAPPLKDPPLIVDWVKKVLEEERLVGERKVGADCEAVWARFILGGELILPEMLVVEPLHSRPVFNVLFDILNLVTTRACLKQWLRQRVL